MPLNAGFPEWLLQDKWHREQRSLAVGNQTLQAMELGANISHRNREMLMRASDQVIAHQSHKAQTALHILDASLKQAEVSDLVAIKAAQLEYVNGNKDVVPQVSTYKGQRTWHDWTLNFDAEQGEAEEWEGFIADYNKLDGFAKSKVRAASPEWPPRKGGISPTTYEALGSEQKRIREEMFAAKSQYREIEINGQKFLQSMATGGIRNVPKEWGSTVEAVDVLDTEGNLLTRALPNSSGGLTQIRQPGAKRHSLQDTLDKAQADLKSAQVDPARKTELPGLLEKIKSLKKSIDADAPASALPPPVPVRQYNPATGNFD